MIKITKEDLIFREDAQRAIRKGDTILETVSSAFSEGVEIIHLKDATDIICFGETGISTKDLENIMISACQQGGIVKWKWIDNALHFTTALEEEYQIIYWKNCMYLQKNGFSMIFHYIELGNAHFQTNGPLALHFSRFVKPHILQGSFCASLVLETKEEYRRRTGKEWKSKEGSKEGFTPLIKLKFPTRIHNILLRADIQYLEDFQGWTIGELLKVRFIGKPTCEEILNRLQEFGITLEDDIGWGTSNERKKGNNN